MLDRPGAFRHNRRPWRPPGDAGAGSNGAARHVMGLSKSEETALRQQLEQLRSEHRDLDDVIARLTEEPLHDQLQLQRLKKRKLVLRDGIARIEDILTPDIIA